MASGVEMDRYQDSDDPDSPLLTPTQTQPKWLMPSAPLTSRLRRYWTSSLRYIRQLSWKRKLLLVAFIFVAIYILNCIIRNTPLFASNLPPSTGPLGVGSIDIEQALDKPRRISQTVFSGTDEPAFELETVLFTLYYPILKSAQPTGNLRPWISRPISITAHGYAKFAHFDNFIFRPIMTFALWLIVGSISIPAEVDVPLLPESEIDKFPIMVFSHGMASSRTDYTAYLSNLASHGYVIAAIEHRDGSCPGTVIRQKGKKDRTLLHFGEGDLGQIDTPQLKKEQLAFREAEMLETVRVLTLLHKGHGDTIYQSNPYGEGKSLSTFSNRLNLSQLTIAGHSYGATLALQALSSIPSSGGIVLDPGKESGPLNSNISVPVLVINSESWSRYPIPFFGRPHFSTVKDLVASVLNKTDAAWFLTSLGTAHPSVTDAPLIEPLALSLATGARRDTLEAVNMYTSATLEFLAYINTRHASNLLNEPVTHDEYNHWISSHRKAEFPNPWANQWQIHVSPRANST